MEYEEVDRGKHEWWMIYWYSAFLQEVEGGDSSAASFSVSVEECSAKSECKLYI